MSPRLRVPLPSDIAVLLLAIGVGAFAFAYSTDDSRADRAAYTTTSTPRGDLERGTYAPTTYGENPIHGIKVTGSDEFRAAVAASLRSFSERASPEMLDIVSRFRTITEINVDRRQQVTPLRSGISTSKPVGTTDPQAQANTTIIGS